MDPSTAVKSTGGGGFKEGNFRIDKSVFKVHQPPVKKESPALPNVVALAWKGTRLDEDLEPLTDDDGNQLTEDLAFGFGKSSLPALHPGQGDSPEDEEPADLGNEVGTEGNTLYFVNGQYRVHEMAAVMHLASSLKAAGWKDSYNRMWAPDYEGAVVHIRSEADPSGNKIADASGVERAVNYKVVTKIHSFPYEKAKKAAPKAKEAVAAESTDDKADAAEIAALKILKKIVADKAGDTLTKKTLTASATTLVNSEKIAPQLQIPVISKFKDDKWLKKNKKLGYSLELDDDTNQVTSISIDESEE